MLTRYGGRVNRDNPMPINPLLGPPLAQAVRMTVCTTAAMAKWAIRIGLCWTTTKPGFPISGPLFGRRREVCRANES